LLKNFFFSILIAKKLVVFMRSLFAIFFLSLSLMAFTSVPITSVSVVGYEEISFFDPLFQTNRHLSIWYPVDPSTEGEAAEDRMETFRIAKKAPLFGSKLPMIVLSHGFGGNPLQLSWLIKELIHRGYIVLAIKHFDVIDGKMQINHWQRARDVSRGLDLFFSSSWASFADKNQIGIAGFSLGGTTAIWLIGGRSLKLDAVVPGPAYVLPHEFLGLQDALPFLNREMFAKDWKDPRIKAAFVMAPAWSWIFDEESLQKISTPFFCVAPNKDNVLVTKNNAGFFVQKIFHAKYLEIQGNADHYVFISSSSLKHPDAKDVDRLWIQNLVAQEALLFFDSILKSSR
jgi:predicted dienelactone hydrolase